MYVCMYVYRHTRTRTQTHLRARTHKHTHTHTHEHVLWTPRRDFYLRNKQLQEAFIPSPGLERPSSTVRTPGSAQNVIRLVK